MSGFRVLGGWLSVRFLGHVFVIERGVWFSQILGAGLSYDKEPSLSTTKI